jgi:hypothetical protein
VSILTTLINPKRIEIDAIVTKADGTVVNYGTVALYDKNPITMLCWTIKQALLRGSKRVSTLFKG